VNDSGTAAEPQIAAPTEECDVIMKGGITSGVIYPKALSVLGRRYRFRGIGGASAGAIGAAVGAAAEFGRDSGGFGRLESLPDGLRDGALAQMFQAQPSTKPLLPIMLAVTGNDRAGPKTAGLSRVGAVVGSLLAGFPVASMIGAAPGVMLAAVGFATRDVAGWLLVAAGALLALIGTAGAALFGLVDLAAAELPANLFGICRGLGEGAGPPGFTDWLSEKIDDVAGLASVDRPLRFGQLWGGSTELAPTDEEPQIDLRMITTCLSQGRPYEMPWEAHYFFYDPATWRTLFPGYVVDALEAAPPPTPPRARDIPEWQWEEDLAKSNDPSLRRLPDARYLPIIVATRLSLSFPLLISAVPLWTIDRRQSVNKDAQTAYRHAVRDHQEPPTSGLRFSRIWFTDGGFCSNFPVAMFDAALASRPTFAINLGRFPENGSPKPDQTENVEWARDNVSFVAAQDGSATLAPELTEIPSSGFGALGAFASAAFNTARNWQDGSYLDQPGYRDRIVRVLQSKSEGGLNLYMDDETIGGLAERGATAGTVIADQFETPHFPPSAPVATGWDNHRWVRYRALLSVLPAWLASYARGRAALDTDLQHPPSYDFENEAERRLAIELTAALDQLAAIGNDASEDVVKHLTAKPRPLGAIRRIPTI
jgi:hypothetical protein